MAAEERHDYVYMGGGRDTVPPEATHVSVHESVTVIPARLFQEHYNIVELICHIGVTKIEELAFNDCYRLERVIMPGVVEVEDAAFCSFSGLQTIECERLQIIGSVAFGDALFESIELPSARIVGKEAFDRCSDLVDVKFGKNLKSVEAGAFTNATRLKQITIPLKNGLFPHDDSFIECNSFDQVSLVEEDVLRETAKAFIFDEWSNDINNELDSINQTLQTADAGDDAEYSRDRRDGGKTIVLRDWIGRLLLKIIRYKVEHCLLLSLAAVELAHASPNEIVIDRVLSFFQLPEHEFEGEGYLTSPPVDRQLWENVVQMKQRLLEKDAEIASLKQRVAQLELQSTKGSGELAKNDAGWLPEKRQRSSS